MKTIKIKAPYYGAGSPKKFNWTKDGYDIQGIGIKLQDIDENEELNIILDGQNYILKTAKIKDFVKTYNSIHKVDKSLVTLGVFSISLLGNQDKVKDFLDKWGTKEVKIKTLF